MSALLRIENLSAGYNGKPVLHNVSLDVRAGEVIAVIGQNGCGKSTLLKTLARIITDNCGEIYFAGMKLNAKRTWELKDMGMSWFVQGGMVFPTLKVHEHFELALKSQPPFLAKTIKDECLFYFPSLINHMDSLGGNLSGGQRQMLSFSMLLAQQSMCWLLDEPMAGLSPTAVKDAAIFLKNIKEKGGKTMVLVEHNYDVAFELADKVAIIKEGRLNSSFSKIEFHNPNFLNKYLYN